VLLGLILGHAVALLQLAFELLALAVDGGEVVIGEFALMLLDLAQSPVSNSLRFDPNP
jgi:hypothetical protein